MPTVQKILKAATGLPYSFVLLKPNNFDPNKKYPLIIFLHGIGGSGDGSDAAMSRMVDWTTFKGLEFRNELILNCDKYGYIALGPQTNVQWYNPETDAMLDYATNNLPIDPAQLHLTGLSWGGGGVAYYMLTSPNAAKFATASPIAMVPRGTNYKHAADAKVPIWAFHNMYDTNSGTPPSATVNFVDGIAALGGMAVKTMFNATGHGGWERAYADNLTSIIPAGSQGLVDPSVNLYQWMLLNKLGSPVAVPRTGSGGVTPPATPDAVIDWGGLTDTITGTDIVVDASASQNVQPYPQIGDAYTWGFVVISGSSNAQPTPSGTFGGPKKSWLNLKPGKYTVTLKVKGLNGKIISGSRTVTVQAQATPPPPPPTVKGILMSDGSQYVPAHPIKDVIIEFSDGTPNETKQ